MKIRDKVKVKSSYSNSSLVGKIGTVTQIGEGFICVQFKGWESGHNGETREMGILDRWFFSPEDLKVVRKKKKKLVKKKAR